MSAYDAVYSILKMGVVLPDDAEEIGATDDGEARKYRSKSRHEEYDVPHHIGLYPENPDDPHHGYSPAPHWSSTDQGYHPEVTTHLTMPSEDNNAKTQMHQQVAAGAHSKNDPISNVLAAAMGELHRRGKKESRYDDDDDPPAAA
mgnify:FL=1